MAPPIHIVVCTNKNYLPGAFVTLGSLLDSNKAKDVFCLHVMDTGIGDDGRAALSRFIQRYPNAELRFHVIDATCFKDCPRDYGGGFSTYSRLFMGSLIDAPRCIYVDVDFLVLKDVAELWRQDMGGDILMAVRDYADTSLGTLDKDCPFMPPDDAKKYPYYCAGLLLCDLDAWRSFDTERKAFDLIRQASQKLKAWDQTVLNYLLRDHMGELDRSWAAYVNLDPFSENVNYHFFSRKKPWGQKFFILANRLWQAYYQLRVRPVYRYRKPAKVLFFNLCWDVRSFFFAFFFTEAYVRFRRRRGEQEEVVLATRILLRSYRHYLLHGLDAQSRSVLDTLRRQWRQIS